MKGLKNIVQTRIQEENTIQRNKMYGMLDQSDCSSLSKEDFHNLCKFSLFPNTNPVVKR